MKKFFILLAVITVIFCSYIVCIAATENYIDPSIKMDINDDNSMLVEAFEGFNDFHRFEEFGFSSEEDFEDWINNISNVSQFSGSVILNYSNAVLKVGATLQLTATTTPSGMSIRWVSPQNNLATVSSTGLVTANAVGDAYIIAICDELDMNVACHISIMDVVLSTSIAKVPYGDSFFLSASPQPSTYTVRWETSKSGVTLSSTGMPNSVNVSYSDLGIITVKAYLEEYPEIYSACAILYIPKIYFKGNNLRVFTGDSVQLQTVVNPSKFSSHVAWSSLDPDIATVDETGFVTAISAGRARIQASVRGYSDCHAVCIINVSDPIPVTSISLPNIIDMNVGTTYQLDAVVYPSNATDQRISWSSDSIAVKVQGGFLTAYAPCEATITASSRDGSSVYATCTVRVTPYRVFDSVEEVCELVYYGDGLPTPNFARANIYHELVYYNQPFYDNPFDLFDRGTYVTNNTLCMRIYNPPSLSVNPNARVTIISESVSYTNGIDSNSFSPPASSAYHNHLYGTMPYYNRCGAWPNIQKLTSGNPITVTYSCVVSCQGGTQETIEKTYTFTPVFTN